jgi:hypothetical protein
MSEPHVIHGHFGQSPAKKRSWKQILWVHTKAFPRIACWQSRRE